MRRSSEPEERAQYTVAELLARYGEPTQSSGRRHRRAAEDTGTVAPSAAQPTVQPIAQPMSQPNRLDRRETTVRPSGPLQAPDLPVRRSSSEAEQTQPARSRRSWAPAVGSSSVSPGRAAVTPPLVTGLAPLSSAGRPSGPITDQIPRFDPLPMNPAPWSSRRSVDAKPRNAQPRNAQPRSAQPRNAQPRNAPSTSAQPPAGLGTVTRDVLEQDRTVTADRATRRASETSDSKTSDEESGSPLWEWAAMVSQIGLGVVGGAALWLVCEWLWLRIPVVALVVALAVITGLVWIVRRVRRAEDLQTTVIAVLVGLFVTVSPAALLLVGR